MMTYVHIYVKKDMSEIQFGHENTKEPELKSISPTAETFPENVHTYKRANVFGSVQPVVIFLR